jgi:hypothetical protein
MRFVRTHVLLAIVSIALALLTSGCATQKPYDYSAFKEARPASILVLPPLNNSPDVNATSSMLAVATAPLSESGYYVFPVTLVEETFKQNGLTAAADIHGVAITKLREIFGADSALYIKVTQYGTSYRIIQSETRVTAEAKLVDLRSGNTLWAGAATASDAEGDNGSGGLVAMLVTAVVRQIVDSVTDAGYTVAHMTSARLLAAGRPNGILYGPRSPKYGKEGVPAQ